MKRLLPLAALALIATACSDEAEPAPAVTSSSSTTTAAPAAAETAASSTPSRTTAAPDTFTPPPVTDPGELNLDLEGDPCEGVSSVDFDGTHYECVGGVFRAQ